MEHNYARSLCVWVVYEMIDEIFIPSIMSFIVLQIRDS
jgi:hypothetical protein